MKRGYGRLAGVMLILVWMVATVACSKKAVPVEPGADAGPLSGGPPLSGGLFSGTDESRWKELGLYTEPEKREFLEKAQTFENEDVFFAYDSYVLSEEAKTVLNRKVTFLKRYPKVRVTIEGHCDNRGTNEYNLALGERRANSAYQYFINSGVASTNLSTISFGEEKPLLTGEGEAAWAKNRRDHFALTY